MYERVGMSGKELASTETEDIMIIEDTDPSFVPCLAKVLTHLVSISPEKTGSITSFHAVTAPSISIHEYLQRIAKYFGCSCECFVLSLVYIDRIVKLHQDFSVSPLSIHRLLVTSITLAVKFFDDQFYSNKYYAKVGGVRTREMNLLEAHFLKLINYHLFVTPQEFGQYRNNVLNAVNNSLARPVSVTNTAHAQLGLEDEKGANFSPSSEAAAPITSPTSSLASSSTSTAVVDECCDGASMMMDTTANSRIVKDLESGRTTAEATPSSGTLHFWNVDECGCDKAVEREQEDDGPPCANNRFPSYHHHCSRARTALQMHVC